MHRKKMITPVSLILLFTGIIIIDIIYEFSADYPIEILFQYASLMGIASIFFFILAGSFFISRIAYTFIAKKSLLPSALMHIFQRNILLLKKIHPTFGALAISLALLHGYILFFRVFPFETDSDIISGFFVLSINVLTGLSGVLLIYTASNRAIRHIHRILASITAFLAIIHWFFAIFFN
jgi:hypothetical protein